MRLVDFVLENGGKITKWLIIASKTKDQQKNLLSVTIVVLSEADAKENGVQTMKWLNTASRINVRVLPIRGYSLSLTTAWVQYPIVHNQNF